MKHFDYIIVGAGPTGLTLAWCLANLNKSILLVEREGQIGGCHAVRRVDKLFTEHGPRIYLDNYKLLKQLLNEFGTDFHSLFTPYNFTVSKIGGQSISHFSIVEMFWLSTGYLWFTFTPYWAKKTSVLDFASTHNFSKQAVDYLDRLCRLTDGAGVDRYTLYEFYNLVNQNSFYTVYQPRLPNDVGLFKIWQEKLEQTGKVQILLNSKISNIQINNDLIETVEVNGEKYSTDRLLLSIPPVEIYNLINKTDVKNTFGPINNLSQFSKNSEYFTYVPIAYHFDHQIDLPKVWGFPASDWGIAFVVLTDYMKFDDPRSKTVISTCITLPNSKSSITGKTAEESNENELKNEVFRQLKEVYPNLPLPTVMLMSPGIYREGEVWKTMDNAFMFTKFGYMSNKSDSIKNMYNVGCHNGNSWYAFTSMEAAMQNAVSLLHEIEPLSRKRWQISNIVTINEILFFVIVLIIFVLLYIF